MFTENWLVGVDSYFVDEGQLCEFDEYHRGRLTIEERIASSVSIGLAPS